MSDIQEILDRFAACEDYYSEEYKRGREDTEFLWGEQWDAAAKKARGNRPTLVENRLLPFKHQVLNNIRQSDLAIKVSPLDDEADVETAEIRQGMIRNIEVSSKASIAYDTGADRAIDSGYGYIRVITRYCDDSSFDKEIRIERVVNSESIYLDPNDMSLDGSGAEYGFVFDDVPEEKFKTENKGIGLDSISDSKGWRSDKTVRIAEYFYKTYEKKTLVKLADGRVMFEDEVPDEIKDAIIDDRDVQIPTVNWCKFNGKEKWDEKEFPGKYIPIARVCGEEAWLDGRRKFFSLIHQAKDPQRALNYWISADTEVMALQPKVPYIGAVGQFNSRATEWQNANITNPATLEYDIVFGIDPVSGQAVPAPPPMREQPPSSSPGMAQAIMRNAEAIKATLGMHDAVQGEIGNEMISGKALREGKLSGDNANFHFIDNLGAAIEHVGRIIDGIISVEYTEPQMQRILGLDGTEEIVPVNQEFVKTEKGRVPYSKFKGQQGVKPTGKYDLATGKYHVAVSVGPSYASRRQETVDMILQLAQANPDILKVAGDLLVKNLDGPNTDELVKRIRASMDPAVLGDDPQAAKLQQAQSAAQAMQEQLVQMQVQLDGKLNNQQFSNDLESEKVRQAGEKLKIDASLAQAEVAKTQAEIVKMGQSHEAVPPEAIAELAATVADILHRGTHLESAIQQIAARREEAPSQPRGFIDRVMGRNS